MPGPEAAAVTMNEVVVHGWDLATATGQQFEVDDASVQICIWFAEPFSTPETAEFRGDAFGAVIPVPDAAPALDRLLGMMGRSAQSGGLAGQLLDASPVARGERLGRREPGAADAADVGQGEVSRRGGRP